MSRVVADCRPSGVAQPDRRPARRLDHPAGHPPCWNTRIQGRGLMPLSPAAVRDYLRLKLVASPTRSSPSSSLDSQVPPTEPDVVQGRSTNLGVSAGARAARLALNASAVILAHQHPSGVTVPSAADRALTERLKAALAMVDVRVVDHFIVGKGTPYFFAESGLL